MSRIKAIRDFAAGVLDESALSTNMEGSDTFDLENDEEFMQECAALCLPSIVQAEILGESAEGYDEAVVECMVKMSNYYVGQGVLAEAAAVSMSNPKINFVRLNKDAQIKRLSKIITLKLSRKNGLKAYKKYKLGQQIKKTNMEEMTKRFGAKAENLAKKMWAKTHRGGKLTATAAKSKK